MKSEKSEGRMRRCIVDSKPKVFIEDGLSLYQKTGIGQYTQNIHGALEDMGYKVIMPRKYFIEKIKNSTIKRILYNLWLNLIFPILVIFSGASKIIFTNYLTPLYKIPTKQYYPVIHDLCAIKFPETMSKTKRNYQTWILNVTKKHYHKIITVSNTVKKEIIDFYKCSESEVCVIYNYFSFGENPQIALSENKQLELLRKYGIESKKYILSVGTLNKRKNLQALVDAYININTDIKLVLVGAKHSQNFNNLNDNVIFTGYLNDEELKAIYKHSLIYVFPSIYEGFGIPLIDAQAFGVPVLCSDIDVFKEVCGESTLYSTIYSNDISIKLKQLIEDSNLRQDLVLEGTKNIHRFSSENIKEQIRTAL